MSGNKQEVVHCTYTLTCHQVYRDRACPLKSASPQSTCTLRENAPYLVVFLFYHVFLNLEKGMVTFKYMLTCPPPSI